MNGKSYFLNSRVAWKLLKVVKINRESDDFVIVIATTSSYDFYSSFLRVS